MSEVKKNEYIEISITDILCKLWRNKVVFLLVLVVALAIGGVFVAKKNYNTYTYSAKISLPISSDGILLVISKSVSDIFSNKYPAESKKLSVVNSSDAYSVNLEYSSKQPIQRNDLDKRVSKFVEFLNNTDSLNRATFIYVNSLNEADQHIKFLEAKVKEYQSKQSSEIVDLGMMMIEDNLITYNSMKFQAEQDLKNAKFVVDDTSVNHSKTSKKKYVLVVIILSFMLSVFAALGVDYMREKFLNKK